MEPLKRRYTDIRLRSLSDCFGFSINFRQHKNIFILARFENVWMFWKAMRLNRSFLRFTSFGVRFLYPLSMYASSRFRGFISWLGFDRFWSTYGRLTDDKDDTVQVSRIIINNSQRFGLRRQLSDIIFVSLGLAFAVSGAHIGVPQIGSKLGWVTTGLWYAEGHW